MKVYKVTIFTINTGSRIEGFRTECHIFKSEKEAKKQDPDIEKNDSGSYREECDDYSCWDRYNISVTEDVFDVDEDSEPMFSFKCGA